MLEKALCEKDAECQIKEEIVEKKWKEKNKEDVKFYKVTEYIYLL